MNAPGLEIQGMPTIGKDITNQVFFTDVFVPDDYLVGKRGSGFQYISEALDLERFTMFTLSPIEDRTRVLVEWVRQAKRDDEPLKQDPNVRRLIAQSIAFIYAPGEREWVESDPLDVAATGARKRSVDGVIALEQAALEMPEGIVLRYGFLYGPGTWFPDEKRAKPALHVDAAAQAALLAVSNGARGIYNVAEDDGAISSEKAKREFGFDAQFRF